MALTLLLAAFSLAAPALTPNDPNATDAARIKDIVISETDYTAQQIKIMEAGAAAGSVQTGGVQTAEQADDAK